MLKINMDGKQSFILNDMKNQDVVIKQHTKMLLKEN